MPALLLSVPALAGPEGIPDVLIYSGTSHDPHVINSSLAYGASSSSSSSAASTLVALEAVAPVPPRESSCAQGNTRAAGAKSGCEPSEGLLVEGIQLLPMLLCQKVPFAGLRFVFLVGFGFSV